MSDLHSYSASFKMHDWGDLNEQLQKTYLTLLRSMSNVSFSTGEFHVYLDPAMGVGIMGLNGTTMDQDEFVQEMQKLAEKFNFKVLYVDQL